MSCPEILDTPALVCWTKQSDVAGNEVFYNLTRPLNSTRKRYLYYELELGQNTGAGVQVAVRMSNDGTTWDSAVAVDTTTHTGTGTTYSSGFIDLTGLAGLTSKLFVQVGVLVLNSSGSGTELVRARLTLHFKLS